MNRFKGILCVLEPSEDCQPILTRTVALSEFSKLHVYVCEAIDDSGMRHGVFTKMPKEQVSDYVEDTRRKHTDSLSALLDDLASAQEGDMLDYLKPAGSVTPIMLEG